MTINRVFTWPAAWNNITAMQEKKLFLFYFFNLLCLFFIDQYSDFEQRYNAAKLSVVNRSAQKAAVIESLERDMELLCVTGVEDKLQDNVRNTLEQLRNAGIKVWMLTGKTC